MDLTRWNIFIRIIIRGEGYNVLKWRNPKWWWYILFQVDSIRTLHWKWIPCKAVHNDGLDENRWCNQHNCTQMSPYLKFQFANTLIIIKCIDHKWHESHWFNGFHRNITILVHLVKTAKEIFLRKLYPKENWQIASTIAIIWCCISYIPPYNVFEFCIHINIMNKCNA